MANSKNPLTPALRKLIETCIELKTTETRRLASHLNRSPATVRTEFQRIFVVLHVHCRYEAVITAENKGWLFVEKKDSTKNVCI